MSGADEQLIREVVAEAALLDRGVFVKFDVDGELTDVFSTPYVAAGTAWVYTPPRQGDQW